MSRRIAMMSLAGLAAALLILTQSSSKQTSRPHPGIMREPQQFLIEFGQNKPSVAFRDLLFYEARECSDKADLRLDAHDETLVNNLKSTIEDHLRSRGLQNGDSILMAEFIISYPSMDIERANK